MATLIGQELTNRQIALELSLSKGVGVYGESLQGYAGAFEGSKAQLRIVPKDGTGPPTTGAHTKGEIFMDSAANLFVCVKGGPASSWRKVTTTVA